MPFCKIVLTNSLQTFSYQDSGALSYQIPENLEEKLAVGALVLVPFRKQKENGLVIDIYNSLDEEEKKFKIRDIEDLLDQQTFTKELIELIKFTADYYACTYTEVVNSILPTQLVKKPKKIIRLIDEDTNDQSQIVTALRKARKKQLEFTRLKTLTKIASGDLKEEIKKLEKKKAIEVLYQNPKAKTKQRKNFLEKLDTQVNQGKFTLTNEQENAITQVLSLSNKLKKSEKFLLHGVTGSGKTEVYIRLIESALSQGKSGIFLVPEISLAPQTLERLAKHFGHEKVLVWHSALSITEKQHTLTELNTNEPKIIVGARSAIFAPVKNLGLIIVDEEHENSYKQDSPAPRYHARKIAEKRGELNSCPVVFGSATPNIELYYKASSKAFPDYHLLKLNKRVFDNPLPEVKIIDMREEFNNANKSVFSYLLKAKIQEALEKKEQVILFLNKRGSASHVFCRNCGYVYHCENCDSKCVYHEDKKVMLCHHCGTQSNHPKECPECSSTAIKFFGLGTQKLEQETKRAFPQAKVARLDSDVSRSQDNYLKVWQDFKNHEIDILIGTQMIAKGLDNPNLTVVGVISADSNFSQLDYSADERGFQLLTQVSGRAGRKDKAGLVIFQSYQPERPALTYSKQHCFEDFYSDEIKLREDFAYPPFSSMFRFLVSSGNENLAIKTANEIHKRIYELKSNLSELSILGPCPALISKINNKYRYHLLIKIPNKLKDAETAIKKIYREFKDKVGKEEDLSLVLDVDNISLY